ncbi:hypothetical protein [Actinoplanes subtropicus]|uniref:hypothetical protein n=1 Tax=Actinoplanes subtropicus TaxID=543632 RepID=UPI00068C9EFD|nr:hypothetical protein [Actinoplanes subtropicus]
MTASGAPLTSRTEGRLLDGLRFAIDNRFSEPGNEHYVAPPVIAARTIDQVGYRESFPHLLGSVYAAPRGGPVAPSDLVLTPAACHHLYPLYCGDSVSSEVLTSVEATCFRGEATAETGRLRSFRMYEVVCLGRAAATDAWRDRMLASAAEFLRRLGLAVEVVAANDPFFGRTGGLLAANQRSQQLKWELAVAVSDGITQAVASANYHKDHFGEVFAITDADGRVAHSACLAFGLDRVVLALRHRHGEDVTAWPADVRSLLSVGEKTLSRQSVRS